MLNWDRYWYDMTEVVASNSKCLSRKIGAVTVRDKKFFVSSGYNGGVINAPHCNNIEYRTQLFRRFLTENPDEVIKVSGRVYSEADGKIYLEAIKGAVYLSETCPRKLFGYTSGQGMEYCQAAHAERNAIDIAARLGVRLEGCSIYMNCGIPCMECAKSIVQAGIVEVVTTDNHPYEIRGITGLDVLHSGGVFVRQFNLEEE